MKNFTALLIILALVGCAPTSNKKNVSSNEMYAQKAVQNNDFNTAREYWVKAVENSELGKEPEQKLAVLYYEYGRALGVTCFFDESETYLKKAYEFDKKTNGPVYMSLTELGRLNLDQKNYNEALEYFNEVLPMLESMNAHIKAPMEFSFILDEYVEMLNKTGKEEEAQRNKQRALEIRKNNPRRFSITERTMYGSQCKK